MWKKIKTRMVMGLVLACMAQGLFAQVAINVGGPATGSFIADTGFTGGTLATNAKVTVDTTGATNPAPQAAYSDERYGNFTYTISKLTPAATYRVRLHFVEAYWTAAGQRTFNVTLNGAASPSLSNFDIFAAAGAKNKVVIKEFNVPANAAGNITIQFASVVNNAKVDAIEVLPVASVAINAGGAAAGTFMADAGFTGGTLFSNVASTTAIDTSGVTNPAPLAAYRDERFGNFTYTVGSLAPLATYRVRLHFLEGYWTGAGQRTFNVAINGTPSLTNFDIFAAAGAKNKVVIKEFNAPATSAGNIAIQFTSVVDNAKIDAIEVMAGTPTVTPPSTGGVPSAPGTVSAVSGNATATLSRTAVSGATSYNVKRTLTSGGPYTTIASNVTTASYANSGLTNGTSYYYVVSAVNSAGESTNSAPVTALPTGALAMPVAPANLSASPGNGTASLSWNAVAGASSYNVKRAAASAGPFTTIAANQTATNYSNTGLTNGSTYYYEVSAVNTAGESANSGVASATPVAPPTAKSAGNLTGINVAGTLDWAPDRLYADLIPMSREFMAANTNGNGPTRVAVDSNGWPNTDFSFYVWAGIDQMNGTYALSFKGQATVTGTGISGLSLSYDAASNTSSGTFQYANAANASLALTFVSTKRTSTSASGSGVTQIKLMRPLTPGATQTHPVSELFNRATKAELAKFQVVRFMDYLGTNSGVQTNWSDRPLPTWASFNRNPGGAYGWIGIGGAFEHVIRLSNEVGTDAWINIPARATDDYVLKVAQLFAYGSDGTTPYTSPQANPVYPPLNPNLKLYVEYSNEVWNTAGPFKQSGDNCKAASDELVSTSGNSPLNFDKTWNGAAWVVGGANSGFDFAKCWRRTAKRTVEVSNIFRSVFGDAAMISRVRPVMMSQLGYAGGPLFSQLQMMLGYYNNFSGNFVTTPRAPGYYIYGAGGSAYYGAATTVSTLDALFADPYMTVTAFAPLLQQDMVMVAALGVKRVAYEGGPSFDKTGGVRDAVAAQAVNDPRMTTALVNTHNGWVANGGDLLVYYTAVGDFQWGFTSSPYSIGTPKLLAMDQLRTATPAATSFGTLIPGTVAATAPGVCSRNWGCVPLQPASFVSSGASNTTWASYTFRATNSASRSVTLSFSSATSAQVAVYVDGVLMGTQTTSGGALIFNAGVMNPGVHGVIVRAVGGTFTLSSVAIQ